MSRFFNIHRLSISECTDKGNTSPFLLTQTNANSAVCLETRGFTKSRRNTRSKKRARIRRMHMKKITTRNRKGWDNEAATIAGFRAVVEKLIDCGSNVGDGEASGGTGCGRSGIRGTWDWADFIDHQDGRDDGGGCCKQTKNFSIFTRAKKYSPEETNSLL